MIGETVVHGIVLTSMPVGEYDRRVTILTCERGRITAFAKGARRPTGAFSACTLGFTYAEFTLYEGKEAYNIKSVDKVRYFDKLNGDIEGTYYGMYFCELAGYLTREGMDETAQTKLLYLSLKALTEEALPNRLVRRVFELRSLAIYGEAIRADGRYYSGRFDGLNVENYAGSTEVCESTLYTVQFILGQPLKKLYTFTVSEAVLEELEKITSDYVGRHVDRQMKSLEVLETLQANE